MNMTLESLTTQLEQNLSRQITWIAAADAKTSFVFGFATAMLGLLAAAAPTYGKWTVAGVAWSIGAAALLLCSLGNLALAVIPRTVGPKLSNIFFGGISTRSIDSFRVDLISLDHEGYLEDLIQQVHINAQIAAAKFTWVKRATIFLFLSLGPWVVATYFLFRDK